MNGYKKDYDKQLSDWRYCYCNSCDRIRYSSELEVTELGIRCTSCGSYDLDAPAWVKCPHEEHAIYVRCPRAGKGIVTDSGGNSCVYRCNYRKQ